MRIAAGDTMTFVYPLLLTGLLLVGIPVLLHLIMRQKPKHLLFPAFRFLLQRHRTNQRKLRLRHLILLALRMLLIAAICFALARPKILNERLNLTSGQPIAAVLVFDTSASMEYSVAGKSRLDEAKRRALELLEDIPENSRLAVLDTADLGSGQWLDSPALVRERIAALQIRPANNPVTSQLVEAYRLLGGVDGDTVEARDALPRFLYVFSDRTQDCWDPTRLQQLQELRDRVPPPRVQGVFVDVGVAKPSDLAILNLELPRQSIPANVPVVIHANVQATGGDFDTQLICRIDGEPASDPLPVKLQAARSREPVGQVYTFERPGLAPGLHQVEVSLATTDNLPFNNVAFATFEVRGARSVLVVSDEPGDERASDDPRAWKQPGDAAPWKLALMSGEAPFQVKVLSARDARKLDLKDLAQYQAICLLNVAQPASDLWQKLQRYVASGGGLAIIPAGDDLKIQDYNDDAAAQQLLPGRLNRIIAVKAGAWVRWDESSYQQPLRGWFQEWSKNPRIGFLKVPPTVTRYWEVQPAGAQEVRVRYLDSKKRPALLERDFDRKKVRGRVLLFTVPLDDRTAFGETAWHDYGKGFVPFYVALAKKTVGYLAGDTEDVNFNFRTGQVVTLPLPPSPRFPTYVLQGPGVSGSDAVVKRAEHQGELLISQAVVPGNFTVAGEKSWKAGFSMNVPAGESQLAQVPAEQIEALLGKGSVLPVTQNINLRDALQGHWSQPVELLPWLMMLLLVLLAVENLLANRFYRREPAEQAEGAAKGAEEQK
jgi:hypothetical protein